MDTLIQADIFFFITTIVTMVVGILVAILLVYAVFLVKDLKHIVRTWRAGTDILAKDATNLRAAIIKGGVKAKSLLDLTKLFYKRGNAKKKK